MEIITLEKAEAKNLLAKYHYLGVKDFMATYNFGLLDEGKVRGVAVFGQVGGVSAIKGWFGKDNTANVVELTRLCLEPTYNKGNSTSFLLGRSLRLLKKKVSLADSSLHNGYIYQACNFSYHGLSDYKTDFYTEDGKLNPRGKTSTVRGVWLPRTRKHRYLYQFDSSLEVLYPKQAYPKGLEFEVKCCNSKGKVYDNRFKVWYKCPVCQNDTDKKGLTLIKEDV